VKAKKEKKAAKSQKKAHAKKSLHSKKSKAKKEKKATKSSRQSSGGCLPSNCLDLAVAYVGQLRTKVGNYQKQVSRVSKLGSATTSKSSKQNAFANTLNQLITAGGGNISNLTCGSSQNNSGDFHSVNFFPPMMIIL